MSEATCQYVIGQRSGCYSAECAVTCRGECIFDEPCGQPLDGPCGWPYFGVLCGHVADAHPMNRHEGGDFAVRPWHAYVGTCRAGHGVEVVT